MGLLNHNTWRLNGYLISRWSSKMYADPHNRERPSLTFRAPTNHEYVNVCRTSVIGVRGLIPPGLYVSQMTDGLCGFIKGFVFCAQICIRNDSSDHYLA